MQDLQDRLKDLGRSVSREVPLELRPTPRALRRIRIGRAVRSGAVMAAVMGLVVGGIAVTSLTSKDAAPVRPADDSALPRGHVDVISNDGASLVALDPNTGESREVVGSGAGAVGNAAWSSDGTWLAYDIHVRPPDSLWVVAAQGEPRRLAEDAGAWAWSPTDPQLAVIGTSTLTLLDASTGRETDLGRSVGDDPTGPVWSPDGTRIVYGAGGNSIYSVDVAGGDHTLLVRLPDNQSIDGIEWSPDGTHLTILADLADGQRRLYVVNIDTSTLRVLVEDFEPGGWSTWFPGDPLKQIDWSPDGMRATYAQFSGPDQRELEIWTTSIDGSERALVAAHTNQECCIDGGDPVWSPDGLRIAFATDSSHLVVNADGTGQPSEIDELTYQSWRGGWYFCYCYG